jgi:hypothetical protein
MSQNLLRDFLANPWIEALASVPLLATLCLIGALQVLDDPRDAIGIQRLWKTSLWLGSIFLVVVAARFIVLAS